LKAEGGRPTAGSPAPGSRILNPYPFPGVYFSKVEVTLVSPDINSLFTMPTPSLKYSKIVECWPAILTFTHFSNFPAR
jgi:hypothetical protein